MSVIEFIILAFALSSEALIAMHASARTSSLPLTRGLAESFLIAAINAVLLVVGILVGNLLRFTPDGMSPDETSMTKLLTDTDNLVYLGLLILVALRLLFRSGKKRRQPQSYDISRLSTAALLGVAVGINTLIVGLALGFRIPLADNLWRATIPLVVVMTLLSFFGIMMGRQQQEIRARRYTLIAILFLLAFALKSVLWS